MKTCKTRGVFFSICFALCTTAAFCVAEEPAKPAEQKTQEPLLEAFQLQSKVDSVTLPVVVRSTTRCVFSDADAIAYDIAAGNPKSKVLLTMEPIPAGDRLASPVVADISAAPDLLGKGTTAPLACPLTEDSKPLILGLYICREAKENGQCNSKPAQPIRDVLARYKKGSKLPPNYVAPEKTYFFQMLVLAGNKVYFLTRTLAEEDYSLLEKELGNLGLRGSTVKSAVTKIRQLNDTLGSFPLRRTGEGSLEIVLPRFSADKCGYT